jgi:hypothetical protein
VEWACRKAREAIDPIRAKGGSGRQGCWHGVNNLFNSLKTVARSVPHAMAVQRYNIKAGSFVERYWQPINTPIHDTPGELVFLLHHVENVTVQVPALKRAGRASYARFGRCCHSTHANASGGHPHLLKLVIEQALAERTAEARLQRPAKAGLASDQTVSLQLKVKHGCLRALKTIHCHSSHNQF